MRVTRDDVAREAGVSSAVVSYVLNDGPRPVAPATRERVLKAITQLGYRRDSVARSLRIRRTHSLGLVLPDIALHYFAVMTQEITAAAARRGLSVIVATSSGSVDLEREHLADLADRRVDGVILMSVDPSQNLRWVETMNVPVVVVDRPTVTIESSAAATAHLLSHGCHRVGRVAAPAEYVTSARRTEGWRRALEEAGRFEASEPYLRHAPVSEDGGYAAGLALLQSADRPDGVVCDTEPHAVGFLRAAADCGVRIPDDVLVVASETGSRGRFTIPRLTSVDSPIDKVADEAVALTSEAEENARLLSLHGADYKLTLRESCGH